MPEKFGTSALSSFSFAGGEHLVDRRRHLDARRLEQVLAVEHDPGAGVVRDAVELPSYVPASTRLCSRSSPPSCSLLSVRSSSAPAASNAWAWVLPSSITSGLSLDDSAVVSFSTMPVHCCCSNTTSTSGWSLLNSATRYSRTESGRVAAVQPDAQRCPLAAGVGDGVAAERCGQHRQGGGNCRCPLHPHWCPLLVVVGCGGCVDGVRRRRVLGRGSAPRRRAARRRRRSR